MISEAEFLRNGHNNASYKSLFGIQDKHKCHKISIPLLIICFVLLLKVLYGLTAILI